MKEFDFNSIEEQIREFWVNKTVYKTEIDDSKPKYYVLDMFPYPSGTGLHVGHPLGYIGSDIIARYKRLKGFNVLHPMGYDSFGLPAEQYAIQTGQHPALTTEQNIKTFRTQLDKLGFSYDWDREVRTSDPDFYRWTQWFFIQMFHSWYNIKKDKAERIESLVDEFEREGNTKVEAACAETGTFTAGQWKNFSRKDKSGILLNYRLAYIADSWVNWCPALGTVLANDEVKDGVSERGGYPVERKLMKQWSLRITAYAERLLNGLNKIDWSESIKEAQRNWIGKSEGCSVRFGVADGSEGDRMGYMTTDAQTWFKRKEIVRGFRKHPTPAEKLLWEKLRNKKLGYHFRRQHSINDFIVDFVCLERKLIIELDGSVHQDQREYDSYRTEELERSGYRIIRFWNDEVMKKTNEVLSAIRQALEKPHPRPLSKGEGRSERFGGEQVLSFGEDLGEVISKDDIVEERSPYIEVFTTRPDTIFGATFITLAPEHELIEKITTPEYKEKVNEYVAYAKNRSERERMADVKKVTGQFTGAYAIHPFTNEKIPIWIAEYVLAGYGTGAVMAVPGHDERDHRFAHHFNQPIVSIIEGVDVREQAYEAKDGKLANSDFLNGLEVKDAIRRTIEEVERRDIGKGRVNYKLRDAIFGRQRYWGEPIPIYYDEEGIPHTVDESDLPLVLPEVDKYLPTESGEPPLARAKNWRYMPPVRPSLTPAKSPIPAFPEGEGDSSRTEPRYQTANKKLYGLLKEHGEFLKKNMTPAEKILWDRLRNNQLGYHFRRQHIIDNYIADFLCLRKKLIIEVDGGIHLNQIEEDKIRENELKNSGFQILRFTNEEVIKNIDAVIQKIKEVLSKLNDTRDANEQEKKGLSESKVSPLGGDLEGAKRLSESKVSPPQAEDLEGTYPLETTTMPGWAGSSWYYLRYEDPHNDHEFASKEAIDYWQNVDFYLGGDEHATGHLLYFRFWTKFMFDLGFIPFDEPAKKLLNQGKIQGVSSLIYKVDFLQRVRDFDREIFVSKGVIDKFRSKQISEEDLIKRVKQSTDIEIDIGEWIPMEGTRNVSSLVSLRHVPIGWVTDQKLDIAKFTDYSEENKKSILVREDNGDFICDSTVEKMSKRYGNVVDPNEVVAEYGADSLRMYEMFLGPIEQHKPWDTKGIDGVYRFLKKLWRLFYDEQGNWLVTNDAASKDELKILYRTIKKVEEDIERQAFNTSVSAFMICVNELTQINTHKREILEPLLIILSPFAPFVTEYLWQKMGHNETIIYTKFPEYDESLLIENAFEYPVAVNGKTRVKINFPLDLSTEQIEKEVLSYEGLQKYFDGKKPKKVIVVKGRMINVVV